MLRGLLDYGDGHLQGPGSRHHISHPVCEKSSVNWGMTWKEQTIPPVSAEVTAEEGVETLSPAMKDSEDGQAFIARLPP